VRFLFVGGLTPRKGPDVLFNAYRAAFKGRDDVTLVIKDFGANGIYASDERDAIRRHAASGALPRIEYIDRQLTDDEMADLYRACDVLVHPYRGEGFGMPVLEAMACGRPVMITAGGPTDEFCPDEACWRIPAGRITIPSRQISTFETLRYPWMLDPDPEHLCRLYQEVAEDADGRVRRGEAARKAAETYSWSRIGSLYANRLSVLGDRRVQSAASDAAPVDFEEDVDRRLLAMPAWRGSDRLAELLAAWSQAAPSGTSACLYLLADPAIHGQADELGEHVMDAAASADVDLDHVADIVLLLRPLVAGYDERLLASVDGYVPLHPANAGQLRLAHAQGVPVLSPAPAALRAWLDALPARTDRHAVQYQ